MSTLKLCLRQERKRQTFLAYPRLFTRRKIISPQAHKKLSHRLLDQTGPHTIKLELPYDSALPVLGIYPDKTIIQEDTYSPILKKHYSQ